MSPSALVVDTDGGTDDAVALWWALADPRVELVAIVVTALAIDPELARRVRSLTVMGLVS